MSASPLHPVVFRPLQARFLSIPQAPLCYWLRERFLEILDSPGLGDGSDAPVTVRMGSSTKNDVRFLRLVWEVPTTSSRWALFAKAGRYQKWAGLDTHTIDWYPDGKRVKQYVIERYPYLGGNYGWLIKYEQDHFRSDGLTYSTMARGSIGVRLLNNAIWGHTSHALFPTLGNREAWASLLNCRLSSYLLRATVQALNFESGYVAALPLREVSPGLNLIGSAAVHAKSRIVALDPTERTFGGIPVHGASLTGAWRSLSDEAEAVAAVLHALEGLSEREVFAAYGVAGEDLQAVLDETGTPAGWFPLIAGYDAIPALPEGVEVPQSLLAPLAREERRSLSPEELTDLKRRVRAFYEAGPGAKEDVEEDGGDDGDDGEEIEAAVSGARIPIPAETFLEELSQKLEVHPISVYWLLRELREKEGVVCQAELERFVEDYVSVTVLRLLGHRWPKEIEAGDRLPAWADPDGIIPLTEGVGEPTLLERVRERIAEDFGPDRVNVIEQEFRQIIGTSLGAWLATQFFPRHISQFKKRPIAWHIQSSRSNGQRGRRGKANAPPAFSCLVYYHRLDGDLLPKLRSQYVGPLRTRIQTELGGLERLEARTADQDERRVQLERLLDELKDFDSRLEQVITAGFRAPVLDSIAAKEPLDKWTSRDGRAPHPTTREAFLAQEQRYDPDLNDGVRVNVAPLQRAGLLAVDVLAAKDVEKAIADRASWRADERRWCREGKLPQPGWWPSKEPGGVAPKTRVEARQ